MKITDELKVKFNQILKKASMGCFWFIILYVIWGAIVSPDLNLFYETAQSYDEDWIREMPDGSEQIYKMPLTLLIDDYEVATFHTILPETVESGMYLAVNTGKNFIAYIEGNEIYNFDNNISRLPGNITKAVIVPIPLEDEYAGKRLTLEVTSGRYDRSSVNTAYIGNLMGIVIILVKNYALQFVMAILLVLSALVTIGIFAYIEKKNNRKIPLIYLAEGLLAICLWVIFDSPLFQIVFRVYFFDGIVGFMLVTTMALPFFLYFDSLMDHRKHGLFVPFEAIIIINFIALTFLHFTGIRSYDRSLIYVDLMLLIYIVIIIIATFSDYLSRNDKSHRNVMFGMVGLSIFSFFEIIVTILSARLPFKVDIGGLFVLTGMIILLFFAILDQVAALEALEKETQNALAATKAKSDFLASMSHEIRTPINAIMGMNEMVLMESEQDKIKEYAKDINSASESLLKIVNDILDFSKIESGKLEIICDNYDFGELIYDVTTLVNMRAENKGLKLSVFVDENLPSLLYGDDKRVREIITNLLNNAVKYTDEGFVNLRIQGETEGKVIMLNISIEDSGQGIKEEDIDKIFSGFSRVNVKQNKYTEGTGLGLSITKRLIELMNGSISVNSEYGKGSTFSVILPQQIVSDEKMGNYMSHRHASAKASDVQSNELKLPRPNIKVLVVDDTALNLKVITKLLEKINAIVTCASSGEEMLKLIQENSYDIIFLDHMMPNMDGIEALKLSHSLENNKCKDVPIIALTANAIVGSKEMYLEAGFDDYLSKPVKINDLYEMIGKHI